MGRLNAISDQPVGAASATNIASYRFDAVGNLASLTRGNGVQTRYAYDEQNRLTDLASVNNQNTQLSRFRYRLREDGKRTAIGESLVNTDNRVSTRSLGYDYDNAGKLTSESGQDGLGAAYANSWNYDAVGNRIAATCQKAASAASTAWAHTTSVSAAFNENDQLTSSSSSVDGGTAQVQNYAYDKNGAEQSVASASGTSTNGWDFEGKLTGTALADASGAASGGSANSFDAAGNRLARMSDVGKASQKTTSYLVDTDTSYAQVIEERTPDGSDAAGQPQLQARYVWGQGLAPLAMWRKMPDGSVKLFFHLSDGQESVRQLTSSTGEVTDSYFYDAWGNGLAGGSGTTENPFRYTGQQRDPDGRYYLRARFYNPGNGRFLSHDPLMGSEGDPASMHRYLYAGADAANGRDPSGNIREASELGYLVEDAVEPVYRADPRYAADVLAGGVSFGDEMYPNGETIKPDIVNNIKKRWMDEKAFTVRGIADAVTSWNKYNRLLGSPSQGYLPDIFFLAESRRLRIVSVPGRWTPSNSINTDVVVFNILGIIFYKRVADDEDPDEDAIAEAQEIGRRTGSLRQAANHLQSAWNMSASQGEGDSGSVNPDELSTGAGVASIAAMSRLLQMQSSASGAQINAWQAAGAANTYQAAEIESDAARDTLTDTMMAA